jgi:ketosteroid isomerase-like protein
MKTRLRVVAAICALRLGALAQNVPGSDVESKILALESAWNQAVETRDTKALDAIFDNGLVYVENDGRVMTKGEYLAGVKKSNESPNRVSTEKMSAQIWGPTAIVTGIYHEKGVLRGKAYSRHGRFIDTWVFKNGTWMCVATQATLLP